MMILFILESEVLIPLCGVDRFAHVDFRETREKWYYPMFRFLIGGANLKMIS